jgi:pimeloyl-ACP methyl ester carboxylesterase
MRKLLISLLAAVSLSLSAAGAFAAGGGRTILSADSIAIAYTCEGHGEPALVFVHCWSCDRAYWKHQVPHFAERYTVVTLDLAGHGESGMGRGDYTIESFGTDVVSVVEALGLEKVVLIGHSMGGPVVLAAAQQIPDRVIAVVGVDTYQRVGAVMPAEQQAQFLAPFKADFPAMTRKFVHMMFAPGADSALVAWIEDDMSSAPPDVAVSAMENMFAFDAGAALGRITVPVYAINSDRFPTDIEAGRGAARSFEVRFMPGHGHFIQLEDPGEFNRILGEVIEEVAE